MDWTLLHYEIYQTRMKLHELMMTDWRHDFTTPTYWGTISFIILYYIIWYHLTDKKRLMDLLFYGSLVAVARTLIDLLGVTFGFWLYKYRILPLSPSVFLQDWTIMPLTYMLVQQYSPNWRQFLLWNAVGTGVLTFVVFPALAALDILQLMRWNYVYSFILMYTMATLMRVAFHLAVQVQEKAREGKPSPLQSSLMQPAFKPLDDKDKQDS